VTTDVHILPLPTQKICRSNLWRTMKSILLLCTSANSKIPWVRVLHNQLHILRRKRKHMRVVFWCYFHQILKILPCRSKF